MKKIIILLIGIFLMFGKSVYAETLSIEKTNYFFHRLGDNTDFSDKYKNYSINGKTAYCIEPGLHEGVEYKKGSWNNLNLSDAIKDKIKLYAYYGYDYTGHKSVKYRMATQSLIWKALANDNLKVTFSTELFGRGEIYDVSNEEKKIDELVQKHNIKPEFDLPKQIYVGEKISLTDKNEVLKNYDIKSDDALVLVRANNLYVTPNKIGEIKIDFIKKDEYKENYIIYESEGYQTMYATGKIDSITESITLKSVGGNITIKKTGDDGLALDKVSFNLKSTFDNTDLTLETNKDGLTEFKDLKFGKYKLKEIKAKDGYELDEKEYTIFLKPNEEDFSKTLEIINKKITENEDNKRIVLRDVPKTNMTKLKYFVYKLIGVIK